MGEQRKKKKQDYDGELKLKKKKTYRENEQNWFRGLAAAKRDVE